MSEHTTNPRPRGLRLFASAVGITSVIAGALALGSAPSSAATAPSFVGRTSASGASTSLSAAAPSGVTAGDLQVAVVAVSTDSESVSTPSGWTKVAAMESGGSSSYAGGSFETYVFTSTSTAKVTFSKSGSRDWQVVRAAYHNAAGVGQVALAARAGSSHATPAVSTTDPADLVVGGVVTDGVSGMSFTPPSGWTERHDATTRSEYVGTTLADLRVGKATSVSGSFTSAKRDDSLALGLVVKAAGSTTSDSTTTSSPAPAPTAPTTTEPAPSSPTTSEPAPSAPTTTEPTTTPTTSSTSASITPDGGTPWRPGDVSNPGYTNFLLGDTRNTNSTETTVLRSVAGAMLNNNEYSEPVYYRSTNDTAVHKVTCTAYGCIGGNSVPLTGNEVVAPGTDGQLIIVDVPNRRSYEFYQMARDADGTVKINSDGSVTAGSMSVVDLDGRGNLTPDGKKLNITGAGVSRLFGLIRANEVKAAATNPATAIPHALQVSMPVSANCASGYREPATKTDGRSTSGSCIQEGAHFYLDPSYNCSGLSTKMSQAICYALQKYGAYDMDNNGSNNMVVYGQHVKSWSTGATDYANVGIKGDYAGLGLPMSKMSSLTSWSGQ